MDEEFHEGREPQSGNSLSIGGWIAIAVLGAILIAAIAYAIHAWNAMSGVALSPAGWIFMLLGVFFTLLVGAILMGLIFYSSRKNYDL